MRRLAGAAAARTASLGRFKSGSESIVALAARTMTSNNGRGASGASVAGSGAVPRGAQTVTESRGFAAAAAADGDGPTGHAEASSDRVGVGLRGDGTAPRFYKEVGVVRM
jgi:hypothetical protein